MPALTGKSGKIEWGGKHVGLGTWSMDINTDMHDVTEFSTGTVQWREFVGGISGWTGSANGAWRVSDSTARRDFQTAALSGTTGTVKLYVNKTGGEHYAGGVLISAMNVSANIDNRTDQTYSLQGNGALAYTTTT